VFAGAFAKPVAGSFNLGVYLLLGWHGLRWVLGCISSEAVHRIEVVPYLVRGATDSTLGKLLADLG